MASAMKGSPVKALIAWPKRPEQSFLILLMFFVIPFLVLLRPLQTPDEQNHFLRAYELSSGQVFPRTESGQIPTSFPRPEYGPVGCRGTTGVFEIPASVAKFAELGYGLPGLGYNYSIAEQLRVPLDKDNTVSSNTVNGGMNQFYANSPVGYIPQMIAISLLKPFNASPILLDMAARLFVLLTYAIFLYFAIKIVPVRKWAIVFVGLLPMMLQQAVSPGADVMSIAPTVLFMAILMRSYYEERSSRQQVIDICALGSLATLATLAKPTLILVAFLIPFYFVSIRPDGAGQRVRVKVRAGIVVATAFPVIAYVVWNRLITANGVSQNDMFMTAESNMSLLRADFFGTAHLILTQSWGFVESGMSLDRLIGNFRYFSAPLPTMVVYFGIAALVLVAITGHEDPGLVGAEPETAPKLLTQVNDGRFRLLNGALLTAAFGIVAVTMAIFWVIWTLPTQPTIGGVQGRYFLAAVFMIVAVPYRRPIVMCSRRYRRMVIACASVLVVFSGITLSQAAFTRVDAILLAGGVLVGGLILGILQVRSRRREAVRS